MRVNKQQKEMWKNIVQYVTACEEIESTHGLSEQEKLEENNKKYEWLMSTYKLTKRKSK